MARISPDQLKKLLDSGLTMSQVERIAAKRGDSVPSPTLLGSVAKPFAGAALRGGQAVGSLINAALGVSPQESQRRIEESRVLKLPFLGTMAFEGQKPLNTRNPFLPSRGQEQIIGQVAEMAGMAVPVGRVATALKPVVGRTLGYATGLGVSGYGIETGYKLQQGEADPFSPGLGTAIPASIPIVGKGLSKIPGIANFAVAKGLGLTQDELTTILTKPNELQAAKASGLSRVSLGNMIEARFAKLTQELSEGGQRYEAIRKSPTARVNVTTNPVQSTLSRFGIGIKDGRILLSPESPPLSGGDVSALERFVAQYGQEKTLSGNAFLNARKALDDLGNWKRDPTKTDQLEKVSRALRHEYDTLGKGQIKGLKEVDEFAAPRLKEVGKLRSEYLQYVDGQWTLKDTALTRLANAGNKGREQVLKRLERYVPGITQQIQLVKALEGIGALSGPRVGTYTNAALLFGGPATAIATGNPAFALISLLAAVPQVAIPILMAFGKAHGFSKAVIRGIIGKLVQGKSFTEKELLIFRQAVINHLNEISPGDQFASSPLGQRTASYVKDYIKSPALGMSIKDVSKDSNLTTKFLEYAKGKTTLSRQEILDFARRPELKKGEADLLLKKLEEFPAYNKDVRDLIFGDLGKIGTVDKGAVPQTIRKLAPKQEEVLRRAEEIYEAAKSADKLGKPGNSWARRPFKTLDVTAEAMGRAMQEFSQSGKLFKTVTRNDVKIPAQDFADSIRRDLLELKPVKVKDTQYDSTTIGGDERFPSKNQGTPGTYEEVVFESPITTNGSSHFPNSKNYFAHARGDEVVESGKKIWREQEIQSDLLQKDNLNRALDPQIEKSVGFDYLENAEDISQAVKAASDRATELAKENSVAIAKAKSQLTPFTNDRFGERIMRERIREKAQKGYNKYRLPTGETIGKIEGFQQDTWYSPITQRAVIPEQIRIGQELQQGQFARDKWIITDILGDGRFKAVMKDTIDGLEDQLSKFGSSPDDAIAELAKGNKEVKEIMESAYGAETFDLTGKSNPQYRRYEQWGKFLKNKYGGKTVTDPQGNSWVEIDLKKEMGRVPVEAFGAVPLVVGGEEE